MENKRFQRAITAFSSLHYHFVLVTKYRKRCLTGAMLEEIERLCVQRAETWEGRLLEMNGEADHVHFLLALPPHCCVSDFVNALKTNTSRLLRRKHAPQLSRFYRDNVLWSLRLLRDLRRRSAARDDQAIHRATGFGLPAPTTPR